jgi:folate-dependent phosphoribosylglycinamide formyltransferase PurN
MMALISNALEAMSSTEHAKPSLNRIRKIALVGHDNEGSARLFEMITSAFPECEFLLIESKGLYYKKSFLSSVYKLLKEASWIFVFVRFLELVKHKIFGCTLKQLAYKKNIKSISTHDINSDIAIQQMLCFSPDLLVSLFTMQIYKNKVINLPTFGAISSHPSILPAYRGLEVFFWVLANNEQETGVSVFELSERIDEGRVIWQQGVTIDQAATVSSLYKLITEIGGCGLVDAIRCIDTGTTQTFPQTLPESYFPMPDRASVLRFLKNGRKFF